MAFCEITCSDPVTRVRPRSPSQSVLKFLHTSIQQHDQPSACCHPFQRVHPPRSCTWATGVSTDDRRGDLSQFFDLSSEGGTTDENFQKWEQYILLDTYPPLSKNLVWVREQADSRAVQVRHHVSWRWILMATRADPLVGLSRVAMMLSPILAREVEHANGEAEPKFDRWGSPRATGEYLTILMKIRLHCDIFYKWMVPIGQLQFPLPFCCLKKKNITVTHWFTVFIPSLTLISKDKLNSAFTSHQTDEPCLLHNRQAYTRRRLEAKIRCPKDSPRLLRLSSFILIYSYLAVIVSVLASKVMEAAADSHRQIWICISW